MHVSIKISKDMLIYWNHRAIFMNVRIDVAFGKMKCTTYVLSLISCVNGSCGGNCIAKMDVGSLELHIKLIMVIF